MINTILLILVPIFIILILFFYFKYVNTTEKLQNRDKFTNVSTTQSQSLVPFNYNNKSIISDCFPLNRSGLYVKMNNSIFLGFEYGNILNLSDLTHLQNNFFIDNIVIEYSNLDNINPDSAKYRYGPYTNPKEIPIICMNKVAPSVLTRNTKLTTSLLPTLTEFYSGLSVEFKQNTGTKFGTSTNLDDTINLSFYGYCMKNTRSGDDIIPIPSTKFPQFVTMKFMLDVIRMDHVIIKPVLGDIDPLLYIDLNIFSTRQMNLREDHYLYNPITSIETIGTNLYKVNLSKRSEISSRGIYGGGGRLIYIEDTPPRSAIILSTSLDVIDFFNKNPTIIQEVIIDINNDTVIIPKQIILDNGSSLEFRSGTITFEDNNSFKAVGQNIDIYINGGIVNINNAFCQINRRCTLHISGGIININSNIIKPGIETCGDTIVTGGTININASNSGIGWKYYMAATGNFNMKNNILNIDAKDIAHGIYILDGDIHMNNTELTINTYDTPANGIIVFFNSSVYINSGKISYNISEPYGSPSAGSLISKGGNATGTIIIFGVEYKNTLTDEEKTNSKYKELTNILNGWNYGIRDISTKSLNYTPVVATKSSVTIPPTIQNYDTILSYKMFTIQFNVKSADINTTNKYYHDDDRTPNQFNYSDIKPLIIYNKFNNDNMMQINSQNDLSKISNIIASTDIIPQSYTIPITNTNLIDSILVSNASLKNSLIKTGTTSGDGPPSYNKDGNMIAGEKIDIVTTKYIPINIIVPITITEPFFQNTVPPINSDSTGNTINLFPHDNTQFYTLTSSGTTTTLIDTNNIKIMILMNNGNSSINVSYPSTSNPELSNLKINDLFTVNDNIYKIIAITDLVIGFQSISPPTKPLEINNYNTTDISNLYSSITFNKNSDNNTLIFKSTFNNKTSLQSNMFISDILIQYEGDNSKIEANLVYNTTTTIPLSVQNKSYSAPDNQENNNAIQPNRNIINMNNTISMSRNNIISPLDNKSNYQIVIKFNSSETTTGLLNSNFSTNNTEDRIIITYYGYICQNIILDNAVYIYGNKKPATSSFGSDIQLYGNEPFGNIKEPFQSTSSTLLYPKLFTTIIPIKSSNINNNTISVSDIKNDIQIPNFMMSTISCFNENTKILCLSRDMNEEYTLIQDIKPDTLVKTYKHGYRKVNKIGKRTSNNDPDNWMNCMYKMTKRDNMTDDLIISGLHGILVKSLNQIELDRYKELNAFDNLTKIDDMYILIAAVSDRFNKITDKEMYTYYHMILDNEGDDSMRYGIYANGILTETPTKKNFDDIKLELIQ